MMYDAQEHFTLQKKIHLTSIIENEMHQVSFASTTNKKSKQNR